MSIKESECYEGKRVGRLTLLYPVRIPSNPNTKTGKNHPSGFGAWYCKCDCGKYRVMKTANLKSTSSCGCYKRVLLDKLHKNNILSVDELADSNKRSPWVGLYNKFKNMHTRCENPNYAEHKDYADRGIKVCDEWSDYETFKSWAIDNGYNLSSPDRSQTLDRIDVDGDYEPDNCRFVDMYVQANNKQKNIRVVYRGQSKTLTEWGRIYNIKFITLLHRYYEYGWRGDKLFKPTIDAEHRNGLLVEIEFKGKITTAAKLSKQYNVSRGAIIDRYRKGLRDNDLVTPSRNGRTYDFMGEQLTFQQIADRYGFSCGTIRSRYRQGMRDEELIQPRKGKNQFSYLNKELENIKTQEGV